MLEFRHRGNCHASQCRRLGYPIVGHYDTWMIDCVQLLVERNHNYNIFSSWSNTSDYIETPERFGTVPLQSAELNTAIQVIDPHACTIQFLMTMFAYLGYLHRYEAHKIDFRPKLFMQSNGHQTAVTAGAWKIGMSTL